MKKYIVSTYRKGHGHETMLEFANNKTELRKHLTYMGHKVLEITERKEESLTTK